MTFEFVCCFVGANADSTAGHTDRSSQSWYYWSCWNRKWKDCGFSYSASRLDSYLAENRPVSVNSVLHRVAVNYVTYSLSSIATYYGCWFISVRSLLYVVCDGKNRLICWSLYFIFRLNDANIVLHISRISYHVIIGYSFSLERIAFPRYVAQFAINFQLIHFDFICVEYTVFPVVEFAYSCSRLTHLLICTRYNGLCVSVM